MKRFLIIAVLLLIGIIAAVIYFLTTNSLTSNTPSPTPTKSISPTPTEQATISGYSSESLGFFIEYPSDLEMRERDESVVFEKWGPTQKENTEFYDGISLRFSNGMIPASITLEELVASKAAELKKEPVTEQVGELSSVTISQYSGYRFTVVSMGTRTYIYLPQGKSGFLEIIDSTVDPTSQGFQKTVEEMLSTLKIEG